MHNAAKTGFFLHRRCSELLENLHNACFHELLHVTIEFIPCSEIVAIRLWIIKQRLEVLMLCAITSLLSVAGPVQKANAFEQNA